MFVFDGKYVMIGFWLVGDDVVGIGIWEDLMLIIGDDVLFVLYVIDG